MKRHPFAIALLILTLVGAPVLVGLAQEPTPAPPLAKAEEESPPPISPKTAPPMDLDACIALGFQHQPAMDAARASLNAAVTSKRALDRMFVPGIGVRRMQACQGVTIAEAGLAQVEWETRYSITRNFFTVQYIHSQQKVVADVLESLKKGKARAKTIYDGGDPKAKITKIDLDSIDVQIKILEGKRSLADNGMLKAYAALREAMGLGHEYPLTIAATGLPDAVYEVKKTVEETDGKKKVTKVVSEFIPLYKFDKTALIESAIANRGELIQASAANRVTELEIRAQSRIFGPKANTFAIGSDIHAKPIPQGIFNNEYRPGAIGLEMPPMFAGSKHFRVQRARDLNDRAGAVVEKTHNLVSLDVEAQYLKWKEAVEDIQGLREIYDVAQKLPDQVLKLVAGQDLTSTAVIQANITAIQVRTQLNDEMHIHALALAGLERATAGAFRVFPVPVPPK